MTNAPGMGSFTYDAENRMLTAGGVSYTYDAQGERVMKSTGTLYWHGLGGEVLLETNNTGGNQTEYIFFNGQRIARRDPSGAPLLLLWRPPGSSRIVTNASGTVIEDSDFYPFGGERCRDSQQQLQIHRPGTRYRVWIDYFIARHYASNLGRFLQPDEFTGGPVDAFSANDPLPPGPLPYADITNPQSLNKYTYTYNNPLRYTTRTVTACGVLRRAPSTL
jgi:hypothetical protein